MLQPQNFISDLGGVLGLWLGMSILTIFEFMEFGLDSIVLTLAALISRRRGKTTPSPSQKTTDGEKTTAPDMDYDNQPPPPYSRHSMEGLGDTPTVTSRLSGIRSRGRSTVNSLSPNSQPFTERHSGSSPAQENQSDPQPWAFPVGGSEGVDAREGYRSYLYEFP